MAPVLRHGHAALAKRQACRAAPRVARLRSVRVQASSAAHLALSCAGSIAISISPVLAPEPHTQQVQESDAAAMLQLHRLRPQLAPLFELAEAPVVQDAANEQDETDIALAGMLQVAEQLSDFTAELLSVKESTDHGPLPDVARKMSQQALALASQAVALSAYDLPEAELSIVEQIRAAAQQVSTIASSLAAEP